MPANLSSLAPLQLNSTVLGITRYGFSAGIIAEAQNHSGNQYQSIERVSGATPRITASTFVRGAYDLLGMTVVKATTLHAYLTKYDGTTLVPAAGANHPRLSLSASCSAAAHITRISCPGQDQPAMAEIEAWPLSAAGVAHPLTYSASQTMITLASEPVEHTLGPISINGTVLPGCTSFDFDLGQQVEVSRTDGALYPIVAARKGGAPKIFIGHSDPTAALSALGLLGVAASSNIVIYLRQFATTGVVDTGATAMSFTVASGRLKPVEITTATGEIASIGFELIPLSTDGTYPVAIATGATAPALP